MSEAKLKWRFASVKIDRWWQVVAINNLTGWMCPIAYFVNEALADSYADFSNDIEEPDYSTMDNAPEAVSPSFEERQNIIPFRFANHLTDWSEEQDERLKAAWETMQPKEEIAKALGRTRQAIERRARYLGLRSRSKILDKDERDLGKTA